MLRDLEDLMKKNHLLVIFLPEFDWSDIGCNKYGTAQEWVERG